MKILFFHRWVGVHGGGTETHLKELALRFEKRGHKISLLTREGAFLKEFPSSIKIIRIGRNFGEFDHSYEDWRVFWHTALFMIKSFFKLLGLWLKNERFDLISVHFATEAIVARLFRFFTGTPYIFILEGYTDLEAKEAKRANLSVAISHYEKERCFKAFGFKPVVIPVGIDLKRFSPAKVKDNKNTILTVSRLEPRKDLKTLLETAYLAQKQNLGWRWELAGTGIQEKELKDYGHRLGLKNFSFLGFVPDEELASLYQKADVFILPTFEEGFGIVLIEAMASGVPVISNPSGSVPEVAQDAGVLVENKNPGLLLKTVKGILEDKSFREKLIKKGLALAKTYDWNKIIIRYESAYQKASHHSR